LNNIFLEKRCGKNKKILLFSNGILLFFTCLFGKRVKNLKGQKSQGSKISRGQKSQKKTKLTDKGERVVSKSGKHKNTCTLIGPAEVACIIKYEELKTKCPEPGFIFAK
jgi:hypothetical protein